MAELRNGLVRIQAPHFVAGFVLTDGKVDFTAPIVGYMRGWSADRARRYIEGKGWKASIVENDDDQRA